MSILGAGGICFPLLEVGSLAGLPAACAALLTLLLEENLELKLLIHEFLRLGGVEDLGVEVFDAAAETGSEVAGSRFAFSFSELLRPRILGRFETVLVGTVEEGVDSVVPFVVSCDFVVGFSFVCFAPV